MFSIRPCSRVARSGQARAFTLIELLVCISIIALLVAMLIPSLSSARATAKSLQCLSQIRQVGLASTVYAEDNHQIMLANANYMSHALRAGDYLTMTPICPEAPQEVDPVSRHNYISYAIRSPQVRATGERGGRQWVPEADGSLRYAYWYIIPHNNRSESNWVQFSESFGQGSWQNGYQMTVFYEFRTLPASTGGLYPWHGGRGSWSNNSWYLDGHAKRTQPADLVASEIRLGLDHDALEVQLNTLN